MLPDENVNTNKRVPPKGGIMPKWVYLSGDTQLYNLQNSMENSKLELQEVSK